MSTIALHEQVDELGSRLIAIGALATAVHGAADRTRDGQVSGGLVDLLDKVERELVVATHQLDLVRDHAALERSSPGA
jgi:hypothetical protein